MPRITVAVISPLCRIADVKGNLAHFEAWIRKATQRGAEFVAFPEMALCGYGHDYRIVEAAQTIPGPAVRTLERIAREEKVYLSVGMLEKKGLKFYNAQVVVGPSGYLGHYRKRHPTLDEMKYLKISPGNRFPIFRIKGIRVGLNICADSRHNDTIDALARRGAELIHNPHSNSLGLGKDAEEWTRGKVVYYMDRVLRSRAHILVNNMAGSVSEGDGRRLHFSSGAMVLDPLGQVVTRTAQKDRKEKMVLATIDTDLRRMIPAFEFRHYKMSKGGPIPKVVKKLL